MKSILLFSLLMSTCHVSFANAASNVKTCAELFQTKNIVPRKPPFFSKLFRSTAKKEETPLPISTHDKKFWDQSKDTDIISIFGFLDNTQLNKAIEDAVARNLSDQDIQNKNGQYQRLALNAFTPLMQIGGKLVATRKDFSGGWDFFLDKRGSFLSFFLEGRKKDLEKILKSLSLKSVAIHDKSESIPGNIIKIKDPDEFRAILSGAKTVKMWFGVRRGYQIGPGEMIFEKTQQMTRVFIEEIKEIPLNQVSQDDLNKEGWGTAYDQMAKKLERYPSTLSSNTIVTVVRYQLR